MTDPIFDPLRKTLDRNLRKWLIGQTLGQCPRTGKSMDVRTAVFVLDADGGPYMAMHQDGWREVVDSGVVPALADKGYRVDPSTVRDAELRERSTPWEAPKTEVSADQLMIVTEV